MKVRPCVSVVIVTYESGEYIGSCLNSLSRTASPWLTDIVVVDNASSDDTLQQAKQAAPQAVFVPNDRNAGFGRAMNQGAAEATGEYILLLNPDATVESDAVAELAHFLDHRPQAAACGPKMLNPKGEFDYSSRRGFPTPLNSFAYFTGLERLFPRANVLKGYQRRHIDPNLEIATDSLSGACMMIRRDVFRQVGGFDEDYFLFGDDIDLCWKIREAGHEIWYVPSARVVHVKGASMKKSPRIAQREFYHSMHLFIDKRLRGRYSSLSLALVKTGVVCAELWTKLRGGR